MKISVIITSYNQKDYLVEAIDSVLKQTLQPYEIIIADDCSTDGSQKLIEKYAKRHPGLIRAFCHKRNLGIPKNRNFALRQVRGDLVTFLDGDDTFLPRKLELELETLKKHPEASIIFSNIYHIDEKGRRIGLWAERDCPPTGYFLKEIFSREWPNGCLFRSELVDYNALKQVGFCDQNLPIYEDWDLRIRLASKFKLAYCPSPLVEYRRHLKGISASSAAAFHLDMMKMVYKKNRHLLENLSESDRREVVRKLSNIFLRLEALAALGNGRRGAALRKYLAYLKENPLELASWRFLLRFLLPDGIYRLINTKYNYYRGRHFINQ